ncbi:hypothetical protein [Thalassobaculum litoreum]|uniref:Uncharacterized protein n=1 Tax=Thalassobaculum litoreum DSM 18839 TaxID=1123362 RepID=A0A8G2BJZ2_9PROT|nr:hypothetical protein [Thalassobaculum litoreum]SDG12107.1 hypothetical protein SAMN05660686_03463 [Thalassobaculum litoreum DSM 18839]
MSVTEATAQTNPSWWSQKCQSGEADPCDPDTGGTNDSLGFADLLDMINPLQHIPVVSTLYRELTGDTISEPARMAGGALWGGPAGVIGALANSITAEETGGDIGATTMAMLRGDAAGGDPDGTGAQEPATLVGEMPQTDTADLTDPLVGTLPAGVAQFAAARQAATAAAAASAGTSAATASAAGAVPASATAAAQAGSQEFSGSAASRLDAFIQRANAVRAPGPAVARAGADTGLNVQVTPSAASLKTAPARAVGAQAPQTVARTAPTESPAPLKLASDGNTDVAHWMMRALDRYESMKTQEQS